MDNGSAQPIEKVSIIISRGSLEGVYPGLIMANGASMEGIEASLFFTFFGLDAIIQKRMNSLKVATVGNPAMHMPTLLGALPGMSSFATSMMKKEMEKLDIPPVGEFQTKPRFLNRTDLKQIRIQSCGTNMMEIGVMPDESINAESADSCILS